MIERQEIDLANTLKWYISDLQLIKVKQKNIEILCTNLNYHISFPEAWSNIIDSQIEESEASLLKIYDFRIKNMQPKVPKHPKVIESLLNMEIDSQKGDDFENVEWSKIVNWIFHNK